MRSVLFLLLVVGCGSSYEVPVAPVDAADEGNAADAAPAADVVVPRVHCLMKCPDISAPCMCPDQ